MIKQLRYKLLVLTYFIVSCLTAQEREIVRIGLEQNLSNNYIMSITQDRQGYLWFATEYGLNKFDGNSFRSYTANDSINSISGNDLNKVYADKYENIIWIATQRDGLNAYNYDTGEFKHYKYDQGRKSDIITNDITNVINARDGNLWVSTYHRGLDYFNKKDSTFTHYNTSTVPGLVSNNIWALAEDNKGLVYIGHVFSGITIFNPEDNSTINLQHNPNDPKSLPGNRVNAILLDNHSNIWVGTDNGLALYHPLTKEFSVFKHRENDTTSLLANTVFSITQTADGSIWVGTENGGISILDLQNSMFSVPEEAQFQNILPGDDQTSLSNQTVRAIYEDTFGNIWIGTYGDGINFISHQATPFKRWTYSPIPNIKNSLSYKTAWGITSDTQDRLWIGTDGGGIDVFEKGQKIKAYNTSNSRLTDNVAISAFRDSKGNLWFGSFIGNINIYNNLSKSFSSLTIPELVDVRCFAEDENGRVWVGAETGLYVITPETKQIAHYTTSNTALLDNLIRSIAFDKSGNIWVGTYGEGIFIFNKDMEGIEHFSIKNKIRSNKINSLFKDKASNMWAATGDGLVFFDRSSPDKDPITFGAHDGLPSTHIKAITQDLDNNIWFSTTRGIGSFNQTEAKFYTFDSYYGVPLGDFMANSVTTTSDGTIYFGSHNGVCYFNPNFGLDKTTLPPIAITSFKVYNKEMELASQGIDIPISSNIELSHKENSFRVSFNNLDYAFSQLTEYSYMLKGLENIWYNVESDNSVMFRNIPYGKYELFVKARLKNYEWSEDITSIAIHIAPPLWLSWWAKLIYIIVAIALTLAGFRFYKRRLQLENSLILEKNNYQREQEINKERIQFFTNITHELRTPLTLILGPLEDLSMDKELSDKSSKRITLIYRSAQKLLDLINQLLDFRKTETNNRKLSVRKDNLALYIQEVANKYQELNTKEAITFEIEIAPGDYNIYFDAEAIATIVDNLMSNAIKYTEKGKITLALQQIEKDGITYIQLRIKDTGRGIHRGSIPHIFDRYYQDRKGFHASGTGIGLAIVYNLVRLHQASIYVESELEQGTTFFIQFNASETYPDAHHIIEDSDKQASTPIVNINEEELEDKEKRPIVLIVEDNEEINEYIVDSLKADYEVHAAFNGKEGIEKAFKYTPDIIVSDIMMPEVDGITLTKAIKEDIRTSHIPIILLTAKDTIQDRTEGYAIGAESYITKPFSAKLLLARIKNLLEARKEIANRYNQSVKEKVEFVEESINTIDKEFIDKIVDIIDAHMESENLDVSFIAEQMCMSHSTLYRKIKALTDMTVNEFIRKQKIVKAEKLLLTGKYTISEISYMVGFNSLTYFRQCFKDEYGLPPSEYFKQFSPEG